MSSVLLEIKPSQNSTGYSLFEGMSSAERVHVETFGDGSSTYFFDLFDSGRIVGLIHWGLGHGEDPIIVVGDCPKYEAKTLLDCHSDDG